MHYFSPDELGVMVSRFDHSKENIFRFFPKVYSFGMIKDFCYLLGVASIGNPVLLCIQYLRKTMVFDLKIDSFPIENGHL